MIPFKLLLWSKILSLSFVEWAKRSVDRIGLKESNTLDWLVISDLIGLTELKFDAIGVIVSDWDKLHELSLMVVMVVTSINSANQGKNCERKAT